MPTITTRQYYAHIHTLMTVLMCLIAAVSLLALTDVAQAQEPNVNKHTKAQIIDYLSSSGASTSNKTTYAVDPQLYNQPGDLSDASKSDALAMLNSIRYVAGLNAVSLNDEYGKKAQAGAFVDYAIRDLTHYPASDGTKPDEMSDEVWNLGCAGAGSSNIAMGYSNLSAAILYGWMSDNDSYNIDRVGHRRWCLDPGMGATGFGIVGAYSAMYSTGGGGSGSQTYVVWPAQNMPVELFSKYDPWTISVGTPISNTSGVEVTITKKSDGTTWTLNSGNTTTPSKRTDAYFNINNDWYGQRGCIIFRPADFEFAAGDVYHVKATGVNGVTVEYDVDFFNGYPVESISFENDPTYLTYSGMIPPLTTVPADADGYEVTWTSSDESILTIDEKTGAMTQVAPGTATVTATIAGAYTKSGSPLTASLQVVVPKSIYDSTSVKIDSASMQYTGSAIEPKVTVTDLDTGETLVEDVDYTVSVSGDSFEPGDQLVVWVYGKGRYYRNKGGYARVQKRTITEDMVTLSGDSFVYNGAEQHPTATAEFNGTALVADTDYTVSYSGGTDAGTYKATITGAGDHFIGKCAKEFTIEPKPLEQGMLTADDSELLYTGEEQMPEVALAFNGAPLAKGTDYTLATDKPAVDAGAYTLSVEGTGNFTGRLSVDYAIEQAPTTVAGDGTVTAKDALTYGQALSDVAVAGDSFVAQNTGAEVAGAFAFDDPTAVPAVGTHTHGWTFTPDNANYLPCTGTMQVQVKKAPVQVSQAPSADAVTYHSTRTLADIPLTGGAANVPGTWSWADASIVPAVPGSAYKAVFTPSDSTNYLNAEADVELSVEKATPALSGVKAAGIVYGQSLADSALSGTATHGVDDRTEIDGAFTWDDDAIAPTVADGGTKTYAVTFTPADSSNYQAAKTQVSLEVAKAAHPAVMPGATYSVPNSTATLSQTLIADAPGWEFDASDVGTGLVVEQPATFTARYVGSDAGNYEQETVEVTVTRSACDHATTELRGAKDATCTEAGYSGDEYCTKCGELVRSGVS
ncbi:MAG: hypothetical protein E7000_09575, partial [Coriobacteriaceae bacterium]|nr:hypothetical protein [Coriobacteriaceae bacterium]